MLSHLNIKNYALIEDIDIRLGPGLTTITGETGAGKSIILGAIGLLAGNRADKSMLRNDDRKCVIEAAFQLKRNIHEELFNRLDIDYSDESVIRREFSRDGKSRVFINDSPVSILHLKEVMSSLLDVHSQHENLELNKRKYQLNALDLLAVNGVLLRNYSMVFSELIKARILLEELKEKSNRSRENTEFLVVQLNELSAANLEDGEQENLESEMKILDNAATIATNLTEIEALLNGLDKNPITLFHKLAALLKKTSEHVKEMDESSERINKLLIEAEDLRRDIEKISSNISFDPGRQSVVQERLSLIYQLEHKYRISTVAGLKDKENELRRELEEIENLDSEVGKAEKDLASKKKIVSDLSSKLSEKRKKAARELEAGVAQCMKDLAMINSRFSIEFHQIEEGQDGADQVEFMFSANKGVEVRPVGKVASGGELSRLMLSVKSVLTEKSELPTIIFDEIDSGISGTVADKMARIVRGMSRSTQVIVITHLPQVAARGHAHLTVYKDEEGESSRTAISELTGEERTMEIARLLSGKEISQEAMDNARVLLKSDD